MRRGTGPQTRAAGRALCPPHPEPPHRGLISLLQRSPPCGPRGGQWGGGSARRGQGGLLEGWQGSGTLLSGWVGQGTLARPAPGRHTLAARHAQEGFSHLPLLSAGGCSRLQATTNPDTPHPEKRAQVLLPPGKSAPGGLQPWPSLTPSHLAPNQPARTPQPRDPALLPAPRSRHRKGANVCGSSRLVKGRRSGRRAAGRTRRGRGAEARGPGPGGTPTYLHKAGAHPACRRARGPRHASRPPHHTLPMLAHGLELEVKLRGAGGFRPSLLA